jgi:hypothetical protein
MKPSVWNILTVILLAGVVLTVVIFGVIFLLPNQVVPAALRPISVPPTLALPTATEAPPQFPPTWTKSPLPSNTQAPSKTPTLTQTKTNTATVFVMPSESATSTKTMTYTPSKTNTKASGVIIIVNGTARTATKTLKPTKTPTKKPTITPGGNPLFAAIDDFAEVAPAPSSVRINLLANDFHFDGLPIRLVNFTKLPKHGNVEKVNGSTTDVIYWPDPGFQGLDTFEYKMTDEPGSTDYAMVYINVGSLSWPTDIALDNNTVSENVTAGTVVGTFSTTDPDGPFVYKLVTGTGSTNNSLFIITGSTLKTTAMLNRESTPTLSIRVRSTDSTGLFVEKVFLITVVDVNEGPTITVITAPQGKAGYPYAGSVRAVDPDSGDSLAFSCSGAPEWLTSCPIFPATVVEADKLFDLTGTPADTDGGIVSFNVTVTDLGGLFDTKNVTFTVIVPTPTRTPTPTNTPSPTPT